MNEFALIDEIVAALGSLERWPQIVLGPGDDAAQVAVPAGCDAVGSIDSFVADVHFPVAAEPSLIGYRCMMASASDLAAMGATPGYALVALSMPTDLPARSVVALAQGLADASDAVGLPVVGGNIARGPWQVTVSVHGWVVRDQALTRAGAKVGDEVYVTGSLGGAAAALARGGLEACRADDLDALAARYFLPLARIEAGQALLGAAAAAIDVSDGLLADLQHLCEASQVGVELAKDLIPVHPGATLDQALTGGDDYELCFTSAAAPPSLPCEVTRIGKVVSEAGIRLDGDAVEPTGFLHFS